MVHVRVYLQENLDRRSKIIPNIKGGRIFETNSDVVGRILKNIFIQNYQVLVVDFWEDFSVFAFAEVYRWCCYMLSGSIFGTLCSSKDASSQAVKF